MKKLKRKAMICVQKQRALGPDRDRYHLVIINAETRLKQEREMVTALAPHEKQAMVQATTTTRSARASEIYTGIRPQGEQSTWNS